MGCLALQQTSIPPVTITVLPDLKQEAMMTVIERNYYRHELNMVNCIKAGYISANGKNAHHSCLFLPAPTLC